MDGEVNWLNLAWRDDLPEIVLLDMEPSMF